MMWNLTEEVLSRIGDEFVFAKQVTDQIASDHPEMVGSGKKYETIGSLGKGVAGVCYYSTKKGMLVSDGTKYPAPARYKKSSIATKQELLQKLKDLEIEFTKQLNIIAESVRKL